MFLLFISSARKYCGHAGFFGSLVRCLVRMWQLKIATNKCVAHRISAKSHLSSTVHACSLCDMPLQWSVVTMNNQLVFDQHVANIVHTASTRVYLILKSFLSRNREILVKAFVLM